MVKAEKGVRGGRGVGGREGRKDGVWGGGDLATRAPAILDRFWFSSLCLALELAALSSGRKSRLSFSLRPN